MLKVKSILLITVIIVAFVVLIIFFPILGYLSDDKPGTPITSLDISSGKPFSLRFISNGKDIHVWLNMSCDECSFPVEGNLLLMTEGQPIEYAEVAARSSKRGWWEGRSRSLSWTQVLEANAQQTGKEIIVSGTLTIHGARDYVLRKVKKDAPPPRVNMLRITVTD